jgi:transposase-like protein
VIEDFPQTLQEFDDRFSIEAACRDYLARLRWPNGFKCPGCGHPRGWSIARNDIECAKCGRQTSLTAGTIFEGTRKPMRQWFKAMWWITTQKTGGSAAGLQRILGLRSYQTAWTWLHKLRRAMVRAGRERLSGVVEVDDAFVGGVEEDVVGRGSLEKARIVVAVEVEGKRLGRIRIRHIPDFSGESLIPFVEENVESGSTVRTDGWKGYAGLKGKGYRHLVRVVEDPKRASKLFPSVHRVIALLKRWLLGTHQGRVQVKHLQRYLDEFVFRFNRRKSRHVGKIFFRLAQQGAGATPVSYRELVGHGSKRAPQ